VVTPASGDTDGSRKAVVAYNRRLVFVFNQDDITRVELLCARQLPTSNSLASWELGVGSGS